MRFTAYIGLMLCFSIGFYVMGQPSAAMYVLGCGSGGTALDSTSAPVYGCASVDPTMIIQRMGGLIASVASQGNLLGAAISGIAILVVASSFGAIYIIPALILALLVNFLVVPMSMFLNSSCAPVAAGAVQTCIATSAIPFGPVILLVFNIITVLAIISFIRGPT